MSLEDILKSKQAPHAALAGVPEVVQRMMNLAIETGFWWEQMSYLVPELSRHDFYKGMEILHQRTQDLTQEIERIADRYRNDRRFPSLEVAKLLTALRHNDRTAFERAKFETCSALTAWRPKAAGKTRRRRVLTWEVAERLLDDYAKAKAETLGGKEIAARWVPRMRELGLGAKIEDVGAYKAFRDLLRHARQVVKRET